MEYITRHTLISGKKRDFEDKLDNLDKLAVIFSDTFKVVVVKGKVIYSMLTSVTKERN